MLNKLLIHTCCADCLLNLVNTLEEEKQIDANTELILLFYNPNIHPRSEYLERLNALKKVVEQGVIKQPTKIVIPEYKPKEYFEAIADQSKRCIGCWSVRIRNLFNYAQENNINHVSSTLLSSHYQDTNTIVEIAKKLENNDIKVIYPQNDHEHIKTGGFYKQNFCGCCFSLTERMFEKYKK